MLVRNGESILWIDSFFKINYIRLIDNTRIKHSKIEIFGISSGKVSHLIKNAKIQNKTLAPYSIPERGTQKRPVLYSF